MDGILPVGMWAESVIPAHFTATVASRIDSELEINARGFHIAKLAGAGGITINCTMHKTDFATLNVGDRTIIKGNFSDYYPSDKSVVVNTAFLLTGE